MIEKSKLKKLIKASLPQAEELTVETMADNIVRDAEAVIHSMVRQAVSQQRENLYRKNSKD